MLQDWADDAACMGLDTSLFFSDDEDRMATKNAKRICEACPAVMRCLDYAMADPHLSGIWGATDERERGRIRARRRRQAKAAG